MKVFREEVASRQAVVGIAVAIGIVVQDRIRSRGEGRVFNDVVLIRLSYRSMIGR